MSPRQGVGAQVTPTAEYQYNRICVASQDLLDKCTSLPIKSIQTGPDLLQG